MRCYGPEWQKNLGTVSLFLIVYGICFPVIFLALLFVNRSRSDKEGIQGNMDSFKPYWTKFFWWELIKRALFVIISGLIPAHPRDSTPYFGCIFLIFGFMALEFFVALSEEKLLQRSLQFGQFWRFWFLCQMDLYSRAMRLLT
jgi:hypothetical protein